MNDNADKAPESLRTGDVEGDAPEEGILRLSYRGFVTGPVVERSEALAREMLARAPARVVVFDTTSMEGFDATVRGPGVHLFRFLKAAKLDMGIVATASTAVRLTGTAFGITARWPMAFVKSGEEAIARAREVVHPGDDG